MGFYWGKRPVRLVGSVYDSNNQVGAATSVLRSSGSGVDWVSTGDLVVSGIGSVFSADSTSLLSHIYETPQIITAPTGVATITASSSSGGIAYTRAGSISMGVGSTVVVSSGTTFILNVLSVF